MRATVWLAHRYISGAEKFRLTLSGFTDTFEVPIVTHQWAARLVLHLGSSSNTRKRRITGGMIMDPLPRFYVPVAETCSL